jgi:CRP-like cAMP-binding protein
MEPTEPHLYEPKDQVDGHGHPQEVLTAIVAAPLFADIGTAETAAILDEFDEQSFNRGHRITLEGMQGSDFYVIAAGRARVTVDGWKVAALGPGDFFGELAVLGEAPRVATVSAETPLRCLVLSNGRLEEVLVAHPRLGVNLLRTVAGRFRDLTNHPKVLDGGLASS